MDLASVSHINNVLNLMKTNNFFTKYQNINNKLKKRFMRNPNITDASDEFLSLASQCEHEERWQYAGLCYLAVSRCYQTLGNVESEINHLVKAGKLFLRVSKQNTVAGCPSIGLADLQAASSCFSNAAKFHKTESTYNIFNVMTVGSLTELAQTLGSVPAGQQLLKKGSNICPTIQSINISISYYLEQGDYTIALNYINNIINLIGDICTSSEYYFNFLHKIEVNRVILMLMVQHNAEHSPSSSIEVLERYTLDANNSAIGIHINEDEFFVLQSLILACQSHDNQALLELEYQLWKYLDIHQQDFLRTLIRIVVDE